VGTPLALLKARKKMGRAIALFFYPIAILKYNAPQLPNNVPLNLFYSLFSCLFKAGKMKGDLE